MFRDPDAPSLSVEALLPVRLLPAGIAAMPVPPVALMRRVFDAAGMALAVAEGEDGDVEHAHQTLQLRRLGAQLDVLTWISAELLAIHRPLPDPRPVSLSATTLSWVPGTGERPDERQVVELYGFDALPLPMRLPVRVSLGEGRLLCELDTDDEELAELYAQLVFRHHRRAVAGRRSPSG